MHGTIVPARIRLGLVLQVLQDLLCLLHVLPAFLPPSVRLTRVGAGYGRLTRVGAGYGCARKRRYDEGPRLMIRNNRLVELDGLRAWHLRRDEILPRENQC